MSYTDNYSSLYQVAYILVRMIFYHSSFTWKHWIGLILTSLAYAIPYKQLASMAKPSYADDGELIDGGFDMSTGGVCGYDYSITSFLNWSFLSPLPPKKNPARVCNLTISIVFCIISG